MARGASDAHIILNASRPLDRKKAQSCRMRPDSDRLSNDYASALAMLIRPS